MRHRGCQNVVEGLKLTRASFEDQVAHTSILSQNLPTKLTDLKKGTDSSILTPHRKTLLPQPYNMVLHVQKENRKITQENGFSLDRSDGILAVVFIA